MEWGSLAEWVTALVAVPTVIYAVGQLRSAREAVQEARAATLAETRPYVWVRYEESENDAGAKGVRLCLQNSGRTPALDVTLSLDASASWRDPSVRTDFSFLPENGGVRLVAPGARLRYFVGPWVKGAPLVKVADSRASAGCTIRYRTLDGRLFEERVELSLRDLTGTGELRIPR